MTVTQDTARYSAAPPGSAAIGGPAVTGLDILGVIVAALMILGPLTAGATHASQAGGPTEQAAENR